MMNRKLCMMSLAARHRVGLWNDSLTKTPRRTERITSEKSLAVFTAFREGLFLSFNFNDTLNRALLDSLTVAALDESPCCVHHGLI